MPLSILVPLLLQVGPGGGLPQAPLQIPRKGRETIAQPQAKSPRTASVALKECLQRAASHPAEAIDLAEGWLAKAKTAQDRAGSRQCRALALTRTGAWAEAAPLFLAAREDTAPLNERARLAALAGNASLAAQDPAGALAALELARSDAAQGGDGTLRAAIAVDSARALVALDRTTDAANALAEARTFDPGNAEAWLLSATLSRRQGNLSAAQSQIEKAAALSPVDPEIGLEAGVIAMLLGQPEAARKSWQSVISAAPGSDMAQTAQGYLDQLGK
ncbi:MAG: tetratricopeptide repeat protein [Alphaproteobacteria bacterium]